MDLKDLNNIDLNDLVEEVKNFDINKIGSWSSLVQGIVIGVFCAGLAFAGYWFLIKDEFENLERAERKEQQLRDTFEDRQQKAANLDDYKQQLAQMEESFGAMLRQLPGETEIANLLQDISQTRASVGLDEELFRPESERPRDFYAEAPIRIRVVGDFHQMGKFASGLAALPRIVTLNNVNISQGGGNRDSQPGETLVMEATAMTYRYLDGNELQQTNN